eukprot:4273452-Prymnesium_polylepis.1
MASDRRWCITPHGGEDMIGRLTCVRPLLSAEPLGPRRAGFRSISLQLDPRATRRRCSTGRCSTG